MLQHEIIPPTDQPAQMWCIVLHGLGDSMDGWRPAVAELAAPGRGFVLVQAPTAYAMGWSWYQIPRLSSPDATVAGMHEDIRQSRQQLAELLEFLAAEHAIATGQCVLMGFSQGCCMVLETAMRLSQACAGVLGISGTMVDFDDLPEALGEHATQLPVLQTHGTDDQVVPLSLPEQSTGLLRQLGVDVDFRVYPKAHTLDPYEELPELRGWLDLRQAAVLAAAQS